MNDNVKIVTFTGASGSGKSSIAKELLKCSGSDLSYKLVVSVTTRNARDSDLLGEYECISLDSFAARDGRGAFLWKADYAGNRYGTMRQSIDDALVGSSKSLMILVPETVPLLRGYTGNDKVLSFFVQSPATVILKQRMEVRGDSAENIARRLAKDDEWEKVARSSDIPYVYIRNDGKLEETVEQVRNYLK